MNEQNTDRSDYGVTHTENPFWGAGNKTPHTRRLHAKPTLSGVHLTYTASFISANCCIAVAISPPHSLSDFTYLLPEGQNGVTATTSASFPDAKLFELIPKRHGVWALYRTAFGVDYKRGITNHRHDWRSVS